MKRRTIFVVAILVVNVIVAVGLYNWRIQKQRYADKLLREATRYAGATGETITAFDKQTNRWLAEMNEEPIEVTMQRLTDGAEYVAGMLMSLDSNATSFFYSEEDRERYYYRKDIETILSNRRFRKMYEDLRKIRKREAAELLIKNIKDNLAELRTMLQADFDNISQGKHIGGIPAARILSWADVDSYRPSSNPNYPPTRFGRRYAVFSYILLASFLEIREVRPAVEDVIEFAKEEYRLFGSIEIPPNDIGAYSFKQNLLADSLYNPSLLVTAAFCDSSWKAAEKKRLPKEKLVEREVVDYQARAIEQDKDARDGWLPVVPHETMLKIRYYKGITDDDFNDFFGK